MIVLPTKHDEGNTMDTITVEDYALGIWQNGSNDDVWDACFGWPAETRRDFPELVYSDPECYPPGQTPGLSDVAGELLERMIATGFTVGDLTHDEAVAAIVRRHPILGPGPH